MKDNLIQFMNRQVANWTVLYVKLHGFHWFIKGRHFFTLHEKFEEFYNEANEHIDELAERILALGGKPVASMSECLKAATINEVVGIESEEEMVRSVIEDFRKLISELQDGIKLAEDERDDGTADMLIAIQKGLAKHVWMLEAFLG